MAFTLTLTKWTLDVATKLIKSNVRVHNLEAIKDDMAIIFVVNHFTRLETILLPYFIHKHTQKEVYSLGAAELFTGRLGSVLRSLGSVSTRDPDRDKIIVHSLLNGEHPWMIFPEGSMIKDKKVVDHQGEFRIFSSGTRRSPHTGAAVLALRAEFYRHKIRCLSERPNAEGLKETLARFGLKSCENTLRKRSVIIPVNITYFPIRARDNSLLRLVSFLTKNLGKRAIEELSVEGTVLSEDTDIDITLGDPIDVRKWLETDEFASVMACGLTDMQALETDQGSLFNDTARKMMLRYMENIYQLTTINYDHILATLIRHQRTTSFTERSYRNRIFLCIHKIKSCEHYHLHNALEKTYRRIVFEEHCPRFNDFMDLCLKEGAIRKEGTKYIKNYGKHRSPINFYTARWESLSEVIANEIEPLTKATDIIKQIARTPKNALSQSIRKIFLDEDQYYFGKHYARFYNPEESKDKEICRPFLLKPGSIKAGVVLAHGYLAIPHEVRALAEYFYQNNYAVYVVRLHGHGTSPDDLADSTWEKWYESFNRGYAIIKSITDNIILGGFSTGACLALIAAANKGAKIQSVFSICAPLLLQNYSLQLSPSIVSLQALLGKISPNRNEWGYIENKPENQQVNYQRNPVSGMKQLTALMNSTEMALNQIAVPALVIQGSKDPIVNPVSGQLIFDKIKCRHKELTVFERDYHYIVDGEDKEEIFERVLQFLKSNERRKAQQQFALDDKTVDDQHKDAD